MSIAELAQKTLEYKNNTIKALQACGAVISDNAGLKDFEEAVYSISTTNLHYTEDEREAYEKIVPDGARKYAQLISVGGKTKIEKSINLLDFMWVQPKQIIAPNSSVDYLSVTLNAGTYKLFYEYTFDGYLEGGDQLYISAHYGEYADSADSVVVESGDVFTIEEPKLFYFAIGADAPSGTEYEIKLWAILCADAEYEYDGYSTYVKYGDKIVPSKVTEIVSKNANDEALDTVAIPDAVKNDPSWGYGVRTSRYDYANSYDYANKEYTQRMSAVVTIDGVNVKASYRNGKARFLIIGNLPISIVNDYTLYNPPVFFVTSPFVARWDDNAEWSAFLGTSGDHAGNTTTLVFRFPNEYDTVDKVNAWFEARYNAGTPVQVQYPLYEPIVKPITDNSYKPPKLIRTEEKGTITFENNAKEAVPSTVKYIIYKGEET